ncbi:MAG: leucine-rich repeat domain-containing protein [Fusobacteriaceae bacterium]|nr:leucine-rich repeat domain-containing protein [Fusobacteriaceae bacterium]
MNGKEFMICKYLLLTIPIEKVREFDNIDSIDDAKDFLNSELELAHESKIEIPPETEFWAHCSNLQVWDEHDYDTRLLHSNLSFPLLKRLTEVGDERAKRVFHEEIARRLASGHRNVVHYLIVRGYLEFFTQEQRDTVLLDLFERDDVDLLAKLLELGVLDLLSPKLHENLILRLFDTKPLFRCSQLLNTEGWLMKLYNRLSEQGKIHVLGNLIESDRLDLHKLHIFKIPKEILYFPLKQLDVSSNRLKEIPEWIGECRTLEVLNLAFQHLDSFPNKEALKIPKSLGNLHHLKLLNLKGNQLEELPEIIGSLKSLETLDLSENDLKDLPESLNQLSKLQELDLSRNQFTIIPDLSNLINLRRIRIIHNNLSIFPTFILKLKKLEKLSLSYNKIEAIASNIGVLKNLKLFDLDSNIISTIPESIGELENLEILGLYKNNLKVLPNSIKNLKKLKILDLRDTNIKDIPESLKHLPSQ